jgi:hypothetical protein
VDVLRLHRLAGALGVGLMALLPGEAAASAAERPVPRIA